MDVIVRWFLYAGKYSRISDNMVDMWMLLLGGCCRQISIFVSLVVWQIGGCYC